MRPFFQLLVPACLLASPALADYEKDVLPIFEEKCFNCHGNGKSKGAVNLDPGNMARLFGPGKFITPGDPDDSQLYNVLVTDVNAVDFMPPVDKGDPLTASESRKVKAWIQAGAAVAAMGTEDSETAVASAGGMAEPEEETWTNREGKEITAKLVKVEGDKAVLVMANGTSYPYPIAKLSDESQERVRAFADKSRG